VDQLLNQSIALFVFVPLVAFIASLFWQNRQEKPIAFIVLLTKGFYIAAAVLFAVLWFMNGRVPLNKRLATIYETEEFIFAIQFYYDHITAVFSIVGAVLFFLVSTFSRYYMHRDEGYKRFFNTILFFALGYNLIIFSGNFETLFIGWEIIGLSSFLLIAFYRNRYLPVKNAYKVISNYRLGDVALILAMWMMHHLTHQNITFSQLADANGLAGMEGNAGMGVLIVAMIILAAMIKSAQFPFTSWLPRAMEGPTASSAIFYGSLSVHIGVFLLLRTAPFWQDMLWAKIAVIATGALTGIVATLIARVQPTVKTQIAYSSAAQIGIIFIEIALGFHLLALVHFMGNAFLRTYQLLVSPSVLNYLVHHQYFHYHPPQDKPVSRWRITVHMLGIKEWNLDNAMYTFLWSPFKWMGNRLQALRSGVVAALIAITGMAALVIARVDHDLIAGHETVAAVLMALALCVILFTFSYRGSAQKAWSSLLLAHLLVMAALATTASGIHTIELVFYGSGVLIAFILGAICLKKMASIDKDIVLDHFHGYVYEDKGTGLLFLLAAIGMLGFPVTAAFIGIDVLFTYVESNQVLLITLLALCMIFIELAALRIFLRVFFGQHKKLNHPVAFRSS
jgi:NADH:ubiquinone oxidoreductase subunit 5 (subunit L)/multisubunit Na+/H+ antiporter MnhA subunit